MSTKKALSFHGFRVEGLGLHAELLARLLDGVLEGSVLLETAFGSCLPKINFHRPQGQLTLDDPCHGSGVALGFGEEKSWCPPFEETRSEPARGLQGVSRLRYGAIWNVIGQTGPKSCPGFFIFQVKVNKSIQLIPSCSVPVRQSGFRKGAHAACLSLS